jgi:hypothetical protein
MPTLSDTVFDVAQAVLEVHHYETGATYRSAVIEAISDIKGVLSVALHDLSDGAILASVEAENGPVHSVRIVELVPTTDANIAELRELIGVLTAGHEAANARIDPLRGQVETLGFGRARSDARITVLEARLGPNVSAGHLNGLRFRASLYTAG